MEPPLRSQFIQGEERVDIEPLPPVGGDAPQTDSNIPPAPEESGDGLVGAPAPLTLPAASLPTGDIAPAEALTAPAVARAAVETPVETPVETEGYAPAAETDAEPIRRRATRADRVARWLPSTRQLADAARLRLSAALGPDPEGEFFVPGVHTSMRQAFGLIVGVGLIAGLSRLIWLWATLARAGTVVPIQRIEGWSGWMVSRYSYSEAFALINEQVSGLSPRAPAWIAAGLNALGAWLSLPMRMLAIWLIYGLLMLVVARLLGAGTTLPRFYAAVGYAAVPGLLLIFWPLPVVGLIAAPLAALLALVSMYRALRAATGLDAARSWISLLLPAVVLLALWGVFGSIATLLALV